jgi:hypothetical protein
MLGFSHRAPKRAKRRKTARVYAGQLPSHLNSIMGEANMLFATGEFERVRELSQRLVFECFAVFWSPPGTGAPFV